MNKMFHVFSEGDNVLFRTGGDYIFFNNKFASSCHMLQQQALAEVTMSTHFHSLVESCDETVTDVFIGKLRKAYAMYYSSRYGHPLGNEFRISKVEITTREAALNEIIYILKNPVHHYVVSYPLEYPYSCASYIFMDKLLPPHFIKAINSNSQEFKGLTYRRKYQLVSTDKIPDEWLVYDSAMILPSSYINVTRVRAFWNNSVKVFMFDINKNQTDAKKEIISSDILDLRTSGLSDIQVCEIISTFTNQAGKQSFHLLNASEIQTLIRILKQKAVPDNQIKRCLWL